MPIDNDDFFKSKVVANNPFSQRILDQKRAEEQLLLEKENRSAILNRENIQKDFEAGGALSDQVLGDGLGRLNGNAQIENTRSQLAELTAGPTSAQNTSRRESALEQIDAQTQSSSRQALSRLSTAGVKGGVAAAQLGSIANQGILERRRLERDITADQAASSQAAVNNLANFETDITKFDLSQTAAEKNIDLQTRLTTAQLGTTDRATLRATEAQLKAAETEGGGGKK